MSLKLIEIPINPNETVAKLGFQKLSDGLHKFADLVIYFHSEKQLLDFSAKKVDGLCDLDPFCTLHLGQEHQSRLRFFNQRLSPHDDLDRAIILIAEHFKITRKEVGEKGAEQKEFSQGQSSALQAAMRERLSTNIST